MSTVVVEVRKLVQANKAVAASVATFGGVIIADAVSAIDTGGINWTETRFALGGLVLAAATAAVTYFTGSGPAEVDLPEPPTTSATNIVKLSEPAVAATTAPIPEAPVPTPAPVTPPESEAAKAA